MTFGAGRSERAAAALSALQLAGSAARAIPPQQSEALSPDGILKKAAAPEPRARMLMGGDGRHGGPRPG